MNCLLAACRRIGTARRYRVQTRTVHRHPPLRHRPQHRWAKWLTGERTASTATSTTGRALCIRAITSKIIIIRAESTRTTGPSITTGHRRLRHTLSTNKPRFIQKWSVTYPRAQLYSSMPIFMLNRLSSVQRRDLTTIGKFPIFLIVKKVCFFFLANCFW